MRELGSVVMEPVLFDHLSPSLVCVCVCVYVFVVVVCVCVVCVCVCMFVCGVVCLCSLCSADGTMAAFLC